MDREAILAFVRRNRTMAAESENRLRLDRTRGFSAAGVLAIGDERREYALTVRPYWPADAWRRADVAVHECRAEALRAVSLQPR